MNLRGLEPHGLEGFIAALKALRHPKPKLLTASEAMS
jgi:hypothetical protein